MTQAQKRQKDFIERIGCLAMSEQKTSGLLASLTIAQAILESGWGSSGLAVNARALFGIKATVGWTGKVYSTKTKECYDGVNLVTETALFRAYDSWEESIADHRAFLKSHSRYQAVIGETDFRKACAALLAAGYATDPDYSAKLIRLIETHHLTQYDVMEENGMNIQERLLTPNKYSRPGTALKAVKGIVVHYVGNPGSSAEGNRNYFESLKTGEKGIYASSQYIIGLAGEIIRCVPENEVAYCSNHRNNDTISIECCHPLADGKFNAATYQSLITLGADICQRYKLNPLTDVIRHYDVTGKACPLWHVRNPKDWEGLKQDIQRSLEGKALPPKGTVNFQINNGATVELRANNENGRYRVKLQELARVLPDMELPLRTVLEYGGYKIAWEETNKTITAINR